MKKKYPIIVEVSNHHIHLKQDDLEILFGKGYELTMKKKLSQADDFAAEETVIIEGPKNRLEKVRIVGPIRSYTQVELSLTDSFYLGIKAPLRVSGDIEGSASCKIIGPKGELELKEGVIIAKRHFHCSTQTAENLNLKHGDVIAIEYGGERAGILDEIVVRVHDRFVDRIHLDRDEANALFLKQNDEAFLLI